MVGQVDRVNGLVGTLGMKAPVRAASTGNLTLSGEQTVDGVALVAWDRVLVKDQTTSSENGIYDVQLGAWTRAADFDGSRDTLRGTAVKVAEGATNANTEWTLATADVTFGTTSLTFTQTFGASTAIHAATAKATPAAADEFGYWDSVSGLLRKLTWANILAVLQATLPFLQAGTGATARTVQDKLRERITPYDFGAVGDGVADDTTALRATVAYAKSVDAGVTGEGSNVLVDGAGGTYALSDTLSLEGEGVIYSGLALVAAGWTDTPLFVAASGQSNMLSNAASTGGTFKSNSRVFMWLATVSGGAGAWIQNPDLQNVTYYVPATSGIVGNGKNNIAYAFAHRLQEASNRDIYVVIEAAGNQNISEWIDLGTSSARYAALKTQVEAGKAANAALGDVDVFLWQQGENNSADTANQYEAKLDTLFAQLEAEAWWSTSTAVIMGELFHGNAAYDSVTTGIHQRWLGARSWQMFADSTGLTDVGDNIHYDGPSLFELGYRRYFWALHRTKKSYASPIVDISDPGVKLLDSTINCKRLCAGIDVSYGSDTIQGCEVIQHLDYGVRADGVTGDTWLLDSVVTGLGNGNALFANQDNWTARGVWNGRADNKIIGNTIRWNIINYYHASDAGTTLFHNNHTYAGGSGVLTVDNPVNLEIHGSGFSSIGCYLDNGKVNIHNRYVWISDAMALCNPSVVSLDNFVSVYANGDATPYGTVISGFRSVSLALTDGTVPLLKYEGYASQTWTPNFTSFNADYPAGVEVVGTKTYLATQTTQPVARYRNGGTGAMLAVMDATTTQDIGPKATGNILSLPGFETTGTWTPSIRGTTTAGTYELATADGTYTKLGNMVFLRGRIVLASSVTGGGAGFLRISGLPFPYIAQATSTAIGASKPCIFYLLAFTGSYVAVQAGTNGEGDWLTAYGYDNAGARTQVPISAMVANGVITFDLAYQTAS